MINDTLQKKDDTALKALGISEEVLAFAGPILDSLKERFRKSMILRSITSYASSRRFRMLTSERQV